MIAWWFENEVLAFIDEGSNALCRESRIPDGARCMFHHSIPIDPGNRRSCLFFKADFQPLIDRSNPASSIAAF